MRHSEATRVLHKHKVWKDLHDGQSKIHYVSERDSRRAKIPPGHVWSRVRANENDFGHTITVARQQSKTVSELSFLTAVHTAKGIAKQEGISEIFVCAATPCPTPDYSSSAGWPHFAGISRRTPPATAAEVPRSPCDATMRRPQLVWPGSPQANRVVGMKTKR
jgi:hypothetical protein